MKTGVVLLAHGSRREAANDEMRQLGGLVQAADGYGLYQVAFMQFGTPSLLEAIGDLTSEGAERIIVMPMFLVTGNHVTQDIPGELAVLKEQYPGVQFVLAQHFAAHPALVDIIQDRIRESFLEVEGLRP